MVSFINRPPNPFPKWLYHFPFSHQPCMRIPVALYSHQHLVLSVFWILAVVIGMSCCFNSSTLYPSRAFPLPYVGLAGIWRAGDGLSKAGQREVRAELQSFLPTYWLLPSLGALSFKLQRPTFPIRDFQAPFLGSSCFDIISVISSWILYFSLIYTHFSVLILVEGEEMSQPV